MIGRVVVGREEIETVVKRLAREIEVDLDGRSAVFVGVLKGCVYFFTDLTRNISGTHEIDFIQASSYGKSTVSSGSVVLVKDITIDVRDRDVFIVEDIVTTLADLTDLIRARHPRSVRIVALLSKPARRTVEIAIDFLGLEIDDVFVVGYGLDLGERYRNLPDIHEFVPGEAESDR
jgi:hypoxanthine phosphoribosyltransferase